MKILAVGDFHGRIPSFLKPIIKKEKPDIIISTGDFHTFLERKIWFKHCYGTNTPLWDVIGREKYKKYQKKNKENGEKVIRYLKTLGLPVFTVTGNIDYTVHKDIGQKRAVKLFEKPWTTNFLKKQKISILDYARKKFQNYNLIGYPRSSYPGVLRKHLYKKQYYRKISAKKLIKDYKEHWKRLSKLFKNKENIIFVSHNTPYRTKLDMVKGKHADKRAKGLHYGSYLVKEIIKKYKPILCICGHMHKSPGKVKIGRTVVVNPGATKDKRCAIIDLNKEIKVKFYK